MASPSTEQTPMGFLGPDPGRSIRLWVTFLLRLGIGLSLLSTGLSGYFGLRMSGGVAWGRAPSYSMLDPFMSGLPYLAIALGLALVLGFLTTASAIGAGFYSLILPVFAIVQTVMMGSNGGVPFGGRFGNAQYFEMMLSTSLPNLLTNAAMIWLSPLENNPYSIDALIFGREEMEPVAPRPGPFAGPSEPMTEVAPEEPLRIGE